MNSGFILQVRHSVTIDFDITDGRCYNFYSFHLTSNLKLLMSINQNFVIKCIFSPSIQLDKRSFIFLIHTYFLANTANVFLLYFFFYISKKILIISLIFIRKSIIFFLIKTTAFLQFFIKEKNECQNSKIKIQREILFYA